MSNPVRRRGLSTIICTLIGMSLAGCSGTALENTPLQDYVWELGRKCNAAGITMTSVDKDGRYQLQGANVTSFDAYTSCMKEQERQQPYEAWLVANKKR